MYCIVYIISYNRSYFNIDDFDDNDNNHNNSTKTDKNNTTKLTKQQDNNINNKAVDNKSKDNTNNTTVSNNNKQQQQKQPKQQDDTVVVVEKQTNGFTFKSKRKVTQTQTNTQQQQEDNNQQQQTNNVTNSNKKQRRTSNKQQQQQDNNTNNNDNTTANANVVNSIVDTIWNKLTAPYTIGNIPEYNTNINTDLHSVLNVNNSNKSIHIDDAMEQVTQYELHNNINNIYNGRYQYIADAITHISNQTVEQYKTIMHQNIQQRQEQAIKNTIMNQLELLIDDCDVHTWLNTLYTYGNNNKQNNNKDSSIANIDPYDINTMNTTYKNFAIKGDLILSKLRYIYNMLNDTTTHTQHIIETVNTITHSQYTNSDTKSLIQSLVNISDNNNVVNNTNDNNNQAVSNNNNNVLLAATA